jgi:hypothetical protein
MYFTAKATSGSGWLGCSRVSMPAAIHSLVDIVDCFLRRSNMGLFRFLFGDIGQHARDNIEDSLEDGESMLTSDGKFARKSGSTVMNSDGRLSFRHGNFTMRTDGSDTIHSGNIDFHSDGCTSIRSGNLTFHSDGHITMKSGNNYFDL